MPCPSLPFIRRFGCTAPVRVQLLFVALFSSLIVGCKEPPPEAVEVVRPIKIQEIGAVEAASTREYPGTIRATQNAEMGFEVAGRITEFLVREGDFVEKGQVMARIDARDYAAELDVVRANLTKAEADFTRSDNVYKQDPGAISKQTIDANRRAVDVARAQLAVAQKAVDETELVAPFSGLMARKLVEDFQNVQAKEPVLVLQDNSVLEIQVDVPERDMAQGVRKLTVENINERVDPDVIVSAIPDRRFPAQVKEFSTSADPVTRTFAFRLDFENPEDVTILPGMTARVQFVVDPDRAWSVPVTAARADDSGNAYVWKVDPDAMTVTQAEVELGDMFGDRVRIERGIDEGELVAVSGVGQLRDGMKVREYEQ